MRRIHFFSVFWADVGEAGIFDDSAVKELHNIERGTNDRVIFAKTICFRYWNVGVFKCMEDAILAVNFVGRL